MLVRTLLVLLPLAGAASLLGRSDARPAPARAIATTPGPVYFKPGSTEYYSTEDIVYLRQQFATFRTLAEPGVLEFSDLRFKLVFFLTAAERRRGPRLGYKRADRIMTYAARSFGIKKAAFTVKDVGDQFYSASDSTLTGVFIRLGGR